MTITKLCTFALLKKKKKPRVNFFALNSQGEGFVFIKTLKTVLLCLMLHCSARWQCFN